MKGSTKLDTEKERGSRTITYRHALHLDNVVYKAGIKLTSPIKTKVGKYDSAAYITA